MNNIDGVKIKFRKPKDKPTIIYLFFALLSSISIFFAKNKEINIILEKRKNQLEIDYVPILNKITILQNSGMTILASWDKIIDDYKRNSKEIRYAYEEMIIARKKMSNGTAETTAYLEFGRRCGLHSYIKFGCLLEQNIKKGTKGLREILNYEVREAMEERKAIARKKGDEAGTKLLLPMGLMLIISMIIIIVPAFMSISI